MDNNHGAQQLQLDLICVYADEKGLTRARIPGELIHEYQFGKMIS